MLMRHLACLVCSGYAFKDGLGSDGLHVKLSLRGDASIVVLAAATVLLSCEEVVALLRKLAARRVPHEDLILGLLQRLCLRGLASVGHG